MKRINVTKSFLPPLQEYEDYLQQIWESDQLTNQGPLLKEFELKCADYLNIPNVQFISNGTIGLQVALRALGITEGEIITTAFSYVATASAILWERCTPVFVDIKADNFCIDPKKIEAAITDKTKAIMPVHVFGYACDIEEIDMIAKKHNLKVIYDGAHAFGARRNSRSLLSYGDITMCSFHATKIFHTIEGGCLIAKDQTVQDRIELIKRFGHNGDTHYMLGINAKANEFQAAMGLCNLPYVDKIIEDRKNISALYGKILGKVVRTPEDQPEGHNYAYYPVVFKDEAQLLLVLAALEQKGVYPRRYFYPALNTLPYIESVQHCPVAEDISSRILCLPLYSGLDQNDVMLIANEIKSAVSEH